MNANRTLFGSKHFQLQQVAEGVYAAIHIDGGAAIGNAGIVDLGDRTLIYDTFFTPQTAEDLAPQPRPSPVALSTSSSTAIITTTTSGATRSSAQTPASSRPRKHAA